MKIIRYAAGLFLLALALTAHAQEAQASTERERRPELRQVLVAESIEQAQSLNPLPGGEFVVRTDALRFVDAKNLGERMVAGKGRPIDEPLLAAIAQVVEIYARQNDFPAAQAVIPPQDISNGVVRVALLLGKVRSIKVEGNHWFSDDLLREKLRIERGQTVKFSELDDSIAWTNANAFRQVRVNLTPVPQTGEVDLTVGVQERLPLRLQATYDNGGTEYTGEHRYSAAVTYANLWGKDHQGTYQYLTSNLTNVFRGHAIDYTVPLPWRHALQFSASYLLATPTLFEGFITQRGESLSADFRYAVPLTFGKWRAEASSSLSFKQSNNNLFFLGDPVPFETTDIFTWRVGAAALRTDRRGQWLLSANLIGSPGDVNSRNTRQSYFDSRFGANPRFVYGQFAAQRLTRLSDRISSSARLIAQLSSANLLGSEQFSIGGQTSVRGYSERVLSGDGGYAIGHDFQYRGPTLRLPKKLPALDTAAVLFGDYGRVLVKHPVGNQLSSADIYSVGVGLRFTAGQNLSASFDYGRALVDMVGEKDQFHAKVSLSY